MVLAPIPASEIPSYWNLMIYGDPGVGKTHLAATWKSEGQKLLINCDKGSETIRNDDSILVQDIGLNEDGSENHRDLEDLEEIFWLLLSKKPPYDKVDTVIIDGATDLQAIDLRNIIYAKYKKDKKHKEKQAIDEIWQEDYGTNTARMKRVFRLFRDAPFHLIITCHSKKVMPPTTQKNVKVKPLALLPSLTDKAGVSIQGMVNYVWYLYQRSSDQQRMLLTQPYDFIRAKTRGVAFAKMIGDRVENPDLSVLHKQFLETIGK